MQIWHQRSFISFCCVCGFLFTFLLKLLYLNESLPVQAETFWGNSALGWTNVVPTAPFNLELLRSDYGSGAGTEEGEDRRAGAGAPGQEVLLTSTAETAEFLRNMMHLQQVTSAGPEGSPRSHLPGR